MEIKLKLNGENVVLNISDVTVNGKPVDIETNEQLNAPEFKDGDFCYSTNGRIYYVFIYLIFIYIAISLHIYVCYSFYFLVHLIHK